MVRYHLYLIPASMQLVNAVVLSYTFSFGVAEPGKEGSSNDGRWSEAQSKTNNVTIPEE